MVFIGRDFAGRKRIGTGLVLRAALACFFFFLSAMAALEARDVRLTWDGNTEADLAGYKVYYGPDSGRYGAVIDVGNRTAYTITGLDETKNYYIAATAYSTTGLEGSFSNEITSAATAVLIPPNSPSDTTSPGNPPSTPSDTITPGNPPGTTAELPSTTPSSTPSASPSASDGGGGGGGCFIATAAYGSYLAPEVKVLRQFRDRWLLTNRPGTLFVKCYYRYSPPVADFISRYDGLRSLTRWLLSPMIYGIKYSVSALILLLGFAGSAYFFRMSRRAKAAAGRVSLSAACERATR